MEISGKNAVYKVIKPVAQTSKYRLYLCVRDEPKRECLLQIASSPGHNGKLDRMAYVLDELARRAAETEEEYAKIKKDPKEMLNYGLGFPELLESFIFREQEGRRINILGIRKLEEVSNLVPLESIASKDGLRIDARTCVWILGKSLKLLAFIHGERMSVGSVCGSNILIEPRRHNVLFFDFTSSMTHCAGLPMEIRRKEIAQAALAAIRALSGGPDKSIVPETGLERFNEYLIKLAHGSESSAKRAHEHFYELADSLWKREYYEFTAYPSN